jgi:sarcosine oxidase
VRPEAAITAQLDLAQIHGAETHCNERVTAIDPLPHEVIVATDRETYKADNVVLAAGAWLPSFLGADYARILRVYRQVLTWFAIEHERSLFAPEQFPVFIWELPDGQQGIYGLPSIDGATLKIATEHYVQTTLPDEMDRCVSVDEVVAMHRQFVAPYLRGVSAQSTRTATCLYTVTPDAGFIIDRLPASDRVIVASCCSGHGFKHSPAIGEILADMALGRAPAFDTAPFRLGRFS